MHQRAIKSPSPDLINCAKPRANSKKIAYKKADQLSGFFCVSHKY